MGQVLPDLALNAVCLDLRDGAGGTYYDSLGRPTKWYHREGYGAGGPVVLGFDYTYDRAGNKLSQTPVHDPKDTQTYSYDSTGRLIGFTRGDPAQSGATWPGLATAQTWGLDGVGNWSHNTRTAGGTPAVEERLDGTFNQYYSVDSGSSGLDYDENGNMTYRDDTQMQYYWDYFNRLISVRDWTIEDDVGWYAYDAQGRRVRVSGNYDSWHSTNTAWDGWQGIEEWSSEDDHAEFVYGAYIDEPLIVDVKPDGAGTTRYYYHQNSLYSVCAMTSAWREIKAAYEYDPYGAHVLIVDGPDADAKVNLDSTDARSGPAMGTGAGGAVPIFGWHLGASPSAYTFTGRTYDPESSLHQYRHRYYDSGLGRFVSRDPLGYGGDASLYAYVGGRVTLRTDPTGLISRKPWEDPLPPSGNPDPYPVPPPTAPPPYPTPRPDEPDDRDLAGFVVACTTIQTCAGKICSVLGIDHVDIAYNGDVIYVGAGGGENRKDGHYDSVGQLKNHFCLKKGGGNELKYGSAAGKKCSCASDDDIKSCLQSRPRGTKVNCQGDVAGAISDCCLTGFSTCVSRYFPGTCPATP